MGVISALTRVRILVRGLLRLRWKAVWRERTHAISALMTFLLGGLALLLWHPALALFLWEFLSGIPEEGRRAFLGLALALGYGAWMLPSAVRAPAVETAALLRLPFRRRERILAATAAEFLCPFHLFEAATFFLPPLAVLAAVGVRSPAEGLLRGLALLLLWASAVATRQLLRTALRLTAMRDPVGFAVSGGLLAWLAALLLSLRALPWSLDARVWQELPQGLRAFWPPAWAAQALAPDRGSEAATGLIALGTAVVLLVAARVGLGERADVWVARGGGRARALLPGRGALGVLPLPLRGVIGSLVAKGLREPLRDPLLRRTLGGYLVMVAMVLGFLLLLARSWLAPYREQALLGLGLFTVWSVCQIKANTITFERGGLPRLLVLPLSWRRVLLGLDLAQGLWVGVLTAGVLAVAAALLGVPGGFLRAWGVSVATIGGSLAVMHAVSALFPLRIPRDAPTIAMPAAPALFYALASLGTTGIGIALLAAMPSPWDVGAVALWNALVYGVSVRLAPRTLGSREWGLWV